MLTASVLVAVRLLVQDPCAATSWLDATPSAEVGQSVGAVTVRALGDAAMPFVGDAAGIASIRGTVTGNRAMEVLSDTEMRAYGWCFSVNGVEPAAMPDAVFLESTSDVVRWYFGFAHYKDGEWLSYCTPTHLSRPPYICGP